MVLRYNSESSYNLSLTLSGLKRILGDRSDRPGGEGRNGRPEGKFMKLGGKVNFGVLSWKIDVIRAKKGAVSLGFTNKASFSC